MPLDFLSLNNLGVILVAAGAFGTGLSFALMLLHKKKWTLSWQATVQPVQTYTPVQEPVKAPPDPLAELVAKLLEQS